MKNINYLTIIFISLLAASCSKITDSVKKIGLGDRVVNYQADENADSLIIPPDLTSPNSRGSFTEVIETNSTDINKVENIEVMRDKYRRWLLVDLPSNEVWSLSKDFFLFFFFKIEKENKKIGLLETDYLEIDTNVPDKSLGVIRSMLSKALSTKYGLPIADKYRIRLEASENPNKTEVYLTLASIEEVVQGEMRVWQHRSKDIELETEMLLTLMVFLGSDSDEAINKIQSATSASSESDVSVKVSESGFASLIFPYDKKQSWSYLGWALDELNINIEDRDALDGSYFINITSNAGFFKTLLSTTSLTKTYQLIVKEVNESLTYVYFVDLSEENEEKTIIYSNELFNDIALKF